MVLKYHSYEIQRRRRIPCHALSDFKEVMMAYLHCHNCDWGQDDFWSPEGYNPLWDSGVKDLRESLFKDKVYFDSGFFEETGVPCKRDEKGLYCTGQEYVAWELERKARNIRNMVVKTNEDWKDVKDGWVCPGCGSDKWDID